MGDLGGRVGSRAGGFVRGTGLPTLEFQGLSNLQLPTSQGRTGAPGGACLSLPLLPRTPHPSPPQTHVLLQVAPEHEKGALCLRSYLKTERRVLRQLYVKMLLPLLWEWPLWGSFPSFLSSSYQSLPVDELQILC